MYNITIWCTCEHMPYAPLLRSLCQRGVFLEQVQAWEDRDYLSPFPTRLFQLSLPPLPPLAHNTRTVPLVQGGEAENRQQLTRPGEEARGGHITCRGVPRVNVRIPGPPHPHPISVLGNQAKLEESGSSRKSGR